MTGKEDTTASRREARAVELMIEMCNGLSAYAHAIDLLIEPAGTEQRGKVDRASVYACAKARREALDADAEHEKLLRARLGTVLEKAARQAHLPSSVSSASPSPQPACNSVISAML